jgi:hypothetical protein
LREDYVATKEDAKLSVTELLRRKYIDMTNNGYLDETFDFYSVTLRLQAHERKKIAKNSVLIKLEEEKKKLEEKNKRLEEEMDNLRYMLETDY